MRKTTVVCCLLFFSLFFASRSLAQESADTQQAPKTQDVAKPAKPPAHFYRLDFVVEELGSDGKPVNSRTYSTAISTENYNTMSIRTGSRIPIATGAFDKNQQVSTQYQYLDIGVNFDVRNAHEVDHELSFDLTAELSSLGEPNDAAAHQPVIRQNRWQAAALIPIGKATAVFKSDDLDSKGSTQVVVTATPVQ